MSKQLFKGIKSVLGTTFAGLQPEAKKGYIWFVRTVVETDSNPNEEGMQDAGVLTDDIYDIYFGTKHYGHFQEGQFEAIARDIEALRQSDVVFATLHAKLEEILGLNENWDKITVNSAEYDTLAAAFAAVNTKMEQELAKKADKTELVTDVVYDSDAKKIYLKKVDGTFGEGIDATPFIKDGMLSDVEVVTIAKDDEGNIPEGTVEGEKYIKFTWNTESGMKDDYVLASSIGATYEGSDSIEVSGENIISVKAVESEKVNVDAIPVGGTPLADILLAKNVTSINGGNLQEVLEALFSVNNWAENPRRNVPSSLTVSMNNPSISFTPTATTVEVGTEITVSASAANASASATLSYSGFTYGYSAENDNSKDGDTPASVTITGTKDADSNYKLEFTTNNGFASKKLADANAQNISSVENYDNKVIVAEGTNKITVKAYSPTFSGTVGAQNAVYACSSLKKTDEEHKVAASSASTISGATITKESNDSVTGAYYAFVGFSDTLPTTNDEYRAFIGNGFSRLGKGSVSAGTCNKTYMAVCVPSAWDFSCNTNLGADMRNSFTDTGDVTITLPNGDTEAYKYYALTYKDGAFKDLVIK